MRARFSLFLLLSLSAACGGGDVASPPPPPPPAPAPTPTPSPPANPPPLPSLSASPDRPARFTDEVEILARHAPVKVLEAGAGMGGRIALSARYQGRVMTSAVSPDGTSFGWVNRKLVESGKFGTQFDNFGGEDRFWLGPEGGQFGLYFQAGKPFTLEQWKVPSPIQEGEWEMQQLSDTSVRFKHPMFVTNYSGTGFTLLVERTVSIIDAKAPDGVQAIAYESVNKITNTGRAAWRKESGLLSIWVLGEFNPTADSRIVVPIENGAGANGAPIVNDAYFGKVPADRLTVREDKGFVLFTADGQQRGKIGVGPARAKASLGSYSGRDRLLTVIEYDKPKVSANSPPYVNSMWEQQKQPYAGDVVNAYNDGGGYYEIETSSPGAELAPGASITHTRRTFHFVGDQAGLDGLARRMLGVDLSDVGTR